MSEDMRDMLKTMTRAQVELLVVGAFAMAVHGVPRATGDIDLWIKADSANAERVMRALRDCRSPAYVPIPSSGNVPRAGSGRVPTPTKVAWWVQRERRPRDVPGEPPQALTVERGDEHARVQAIAFGRGA